ncbi:MAG: GFA family protein [Novosphingobium sp.]
MADELHGGCQCGAVRYVARPSVRFRTYACHCTDCQSQTGSAFALHQWVLAGDLETTGECIEGKRALADGSTLSIFGCPACLSRIYSVRSSRNQIKTLRLGTLDDSASFMPDIHIWTRSKQPWIQIPGGTKSMEKQTDSVEEWVRLMVVK